MRDKNQLKSEQKQAYRSILIYYEIFDIRPEWLADKPATALVQEKITTYVSQNKSSHVSWKPVYEKLDNEIKARRSSALSVTSLIPIKGL